MKTSDPFITDFDDENGILKEKIKMLVSGIFSKSFARWFSEKEMLEESPISCPFQEFSVLLINMWESYLPILKIEKE